MPPETPTAPLENATLSNGATAKAKKEEMRTRAAEATATAATGARQREAPPTAKKSGGANSEVPSEALPRRKRMRCPVFGCTRKHALDNCPTFRDITPKERLDLIHRKQLCLFCLRHLIGKECETMGKWPNCTVDSCGKPHHEMLHEVLKAGKPSILAKMDGASEWTTASGGEQSPGPGSVPEARAAGEPWDRP